MHKARQGLKIKITIVAFEETWIMEQGYKRDHY